MKISDFFLSENFHFAVVKFPVYLNRYVFVMSLFMMADSNSFLSTYEIFFDSSRKHIFGIFQGKFLILS